MARTKQTSRKSTINHASGTAATKPAVKPNNILRLARPRWPANDEVTPEVSLRKIRQLESGSVDERLMACFARHVIKPGQHNRARCWVSKRSLRKAFPEHFNQNGFLAESTWKYKKASDFGLPGIFFRAVDNQSALIGPNESIEDMTADIGHAPDLKALAHGEYEQLQQRDLHDEQGTSTDAEQPGVHLKQGVQTEASLYAGDGRKNGVHPSEHLQAIPTVESQPRSDAEASAMLEVTPSRDLTLSVKSEPTESAHSEHKTPSNRLKLSTSRVTEAEDDHIHNGRQHCAPFQQEQAGTTTTKSVQSARSPTADSMAAVKAILNPRLCDILKDFPTAPDDESFLPLLSQLVKATTANLPQAIEEKLVDLSTHVIVHCTSGSFTAQVDTTSLVRPVVKILSRHRHKMAADTYSVLQRGLADAARANNLGRLRAIYVHMLLSEAQQENGKDDK